MAAPTGGEIDGQKFDELHRQLLADPALQFHFEKAAPPPNLDWLQPLLDLLRFIAPALYYIFWAGLILAAALIVYTIVIEIMRRLPQNRTEEAPAEEPPVAQYRPTTAKANALLEEADRLAREGRFGEAVRVLLHRSIEDMEEAFPSAIVPSMTSREIESIEHLSDGGRTTFVKIARAVEASLFAGRPLSADQYTDCRTAYERFVSGAAPA